MWPYCDENYLWQHCVYIESDSGVMRTTNCFVIKIEKEKTKDIGWWFSSCAHTHERLACHSDSTVFPSPSNHTLPCGIFIMCGGTWLVGDNKTVLSSWYTKFFSARTGNAPIPKVVLPNGNGSLKTWRWDSWAREWKEMSFNLMWGKCFMQRVSGSFSPPNNGDWL